MLILQYFFAIYGGSTRKITISKSTLSYETPCNSTRNAANPVEAEGSIPITEITTNDEAVNKAITTTEITAGLIKGKPEPIGDAQKMLQTCEQLLENGFLESKVYTIDDMDQNR